LAEKAGKEDILAARGKKVVSTSLKRRGRKGNLRERVRGGEGEEF